VPRLLLLLTLLLLGAAHVAELAGLSEERCAEACADDDAQGECAPECDDCTCCAHQPAPVLSAPGCTALAAPAARPHTEAPAARPQAAHARKIPHIPRRALA
jgi:hypothetical protein